MAAVLTTNFAPSLTRSAESLCRLIGNLHDILKDTDRFQDRMNAGGGRPSEITRHTGGGAWIAFVAALLQLEREPGMLGDWNEEIAPWIPRIAFSVISAHHSSLKRIALLDEHRESLMHWRTSHSAISEELLRRAAPQVTLMEVCNRLDGVFRSCDTETDLSGAPETGRGAFSIFLICRLFLGALGRADVESATRQERGGEEPSVFIPEFSTCRFSVPSRPPARTKLDELRNHFQSEFVTSAESSRSGPIRLKAPTGLGKTFAAARWIEAFHRQHGASKVFYLAPTTAILNQVYEEVREFAPPGETLILHHLRQDRSDEESEELSTDERLRKIRELDGAQVVTTFHRAVRLLSDLSKGGCGSLRGLRGSIWVFDESQALSYRQFTIMAPLWQALVDYCEATILFMSATPQSIVQWEAAADSLVLTPLPALRHGLREKQEFYFSHHPLVNQRRTIETLPEIRTIDELADLFNDRGDLRKQSLLILVNLARDALTLAGRLTHPPDYIITGYLRPIDIRRQLAKAAEDLNMGRPICMVATSVVQAGVDLDFDNGFVELNDLRDFRQGCGRVGRNLRHSRPRCQVWAFELWKDRATVEPSWFRQRFKHALKADESDVTRLQAGIVEEGIKRVFAHKGLLTDADIDAIESDLHEASSKIFDAVAERIVNWEGSYREILRDGTKKQGFDFTSIAESLEADLGMEDGDFIVIFDSVTDDACQRTLGMISDWERLHGELSSGSLSPLEFVGQVRKLRSEIYTHVAPFSLRRPEIVSHFKRQKHGGRFYADFDFFLGWGISNYDVARGGYIVDMDAAHESSGIFVDA